MEAAFVPLRRSIVLNEAKWCAVDLSSAGLTWLLVGTYALLTRGASEGAGVPVLLGGLFMVYQYAQQAGGVVGSIASNFQNFARMRTDSASADLIWNAEVSALPTASVGADWHEIDARGLTYTHVRDDGEASGVVEATLSLHRGERIALVGPSGSGKSTLLKVLAGLYAPMHGHYCVDGVAQLGVASLASVATLVPQDCEVFEASVRDNLAFGEAHDDDAMASALHLSAFDAVVAALPQGIETPIAERGFNLSGGQRQRLALARGFLAARAHRSSLLLLDEPTSALDVVTEARVFKRLRTELPDACVVASIHRMSALPMFDRVVLMQDGRIVDSGTPAALLARQPLMRALLQEGEAAPIAPMRYSDGEQASDLGGPVRAAG
jgi:ABC-type bacteriocin/lantibiotic exporter with double-glycine peptidase domain